MKEKIKINENFWILLIPILFSILFLILSSGCLLSGGQNCGLYGWKAKLHWISIPFIIIPFLLYLVHNKKNFFDILFYGLIFLIFIGGIFMSKFIEEVITHDFYFEYFRALIFFTTFLIMYFFNKLRIYVESK